MDEFGQSRSATPGFRETVFYLVSVALLFLVVGVALQVFLGEVGLLLSQWGVLLGSALAFVVLGQYDLRQTLSLRRPTSRQAVAAVLLMAGGTPIAWFIAWIQGFFIPVPVELLEALRDFLITDDPVRILWLLFLVAVTPAICEEVVFRGVLLSGSARRFSPAGVILFNGAVFGLFHLTPQTAFRFLPTAWLGVLLAYVAWRTRSIWLPMGMHFLNNGVILIFTVAPGVRDRFAEVDREPPLVLLPLSILLLVVGFRMLGEASGDDGAGPGRYDGALEGRREVSDGEEP